MSRFLVFGTLELQAGADVDTRSLLAHSKHVALLATLVVGNRGLHRRGRLAALLWPELDDVRARNALSKAVHNIRRTLGDDVLLLRGNDAIGINPERLWCDAAAFDSAIGSGELEQALTLYRRGEVLEGFSIAANAEFEQWLDSVRLKFRQAAHKAASRLASDADSIGDLSASVQWSRLTCEISPHDETTLRLLLERLMRIGDRAGALVAYRAFAERLQRDLEAEPSSETQALANSLRANTPNGNGTTSSIGGATGETEWTAKPAHVGIAHVGIAHVATANVDSVNVASREGAASPSDVSDTVAIASLADGHTSAVGGPSESTRFAWRARGSLVLAGVGALLFLALLLSSGRFPGATVASDAGVVAATAPPPNAARSVGSPRFPREGESVYVRMRMQTEIVDPKDARVLHPINPYASPASNPYFVMYRLKDEVPGAVEALTDSLYEPWSKAHNRPPARAAFAEFMQGLDTLSRNGRRAAIGRFTNAIVLDSTFVEAKIWLLDQANAVVENKTFMDSVRRAAIAQRSSLGEFDRVSLDRVLAFQDARWEDAYLASRHLATIAPTTPDALVHLAESAMNTRRYGEAISALHRRDAMKDNWTRNLPDYKMWDLQAHRLMGDLPTAITEWRQVRSEQPASLNMCMIGLEVLAAAGRETEVDSMVPTCVAVRRAPSTSEGPWMMAGNLYRAYGYLPAARRAFRRAASADSAAPTIAMRTQSLHAQIQSQLGEWRSAYANLQTLTDTSDFRSRVYFAVVAAHVGDTATVAATLRWIDEYARRAGLGNSAHKEARAFIVLAQGRRDEAIALLSEAIETGASPFLRGWYTRWELDPLRNDQRFRHLVQPR